MFRWKVGNLNYSAARAIDSEAARLIDRSIDQSGIRQ